jgi:hypothetical protein
MSELYHERFCRITEMPSFVVLPALCLIAFASAALLMIGLWPLLHADVPTAEDMKRHAKPGRWAYAFAITKGNLCGRVEARPEPPRHGPGGRGAHGVRRRRLRRIR